MTVIFEVRRKSRSGVFIPTIPDAEQTTLLNFIAKSLRKERRYQKIGEELWSG